MRSEFRGEEAKRRYPHLFASSHPRIPDRSCDSLHLADYEAAMDNLYAFDPQLPDLALVFDRDAVARLFEQRWPGIGDAPRFTKVKPQDTKYQPGRRCVTTYELLAERAGLPPQRTIGVVEVAPEGLALRLYDDDPRLPWLAAAVDAPAMRERFAALLPDTQVEACAPAPVRYRAGVRCVFRYDVATTVGPRVFFGKLLAEGGD